MSKAQASSELVIWVYRFVLIGLITFAFVIIVGNKYDEKMDVRAVESQILSDKIIKCLKNSDISALNSESLKLCLGIDEINYYVSLNITSDNFAKTIIFGNSNIKVQCDLLEQGTKMAKEPECFENNYILMKNQRFDVQMEAYIGKYDKNIQ